jgi:hypothetical protein
MPISVSVFGVGCFRVTISFPRLTLNLCVAAAELSLRAFSRALLR